MRHLTVLFSVAAGLAAIASLTPPAHAQSVFQKLFGLAGTPSAQSLPAQAGRRIIPSMRMRSRALSRSLSPQSHMENEGIIGPSDGNGPYRTMCVRACDGYYFPIRNNARQRNFDSDVKSCRNACGSDAKLFYYSVSGPQNPDALVDLAGRKYTDLPNAFAYRKKRVDSCACKPEPWSYEEAARHQSYADQEAIELAKDAAFLEARNAAALNANPVAPVETIAEAREVEPLSTTLDDDVDVTSAIQAAVRADAQAAARAAAAEAAPTPFVPTVANRIQRRRSRVIVHRAHYRATSPVSTQSKSFWFSN